MSGLYSAATSGHKVRVRIVKAVNPSEFEPFDVSRFVVGQMYEVGLKLAELLVVSGYAHPDRRNTVPRSEAADHPRRRYDDPE